MILVTKEHLHRLGWMTWFAWRPVWTMDGHMVWGDSVERRWNPEGATWCDSSGHSGTEGAWEYRLPLAYQGAPA